MELIKITEQNGKKAVSARELHAFLESKRDFSNWIKDRIEKYGFIEGVDFQSFNKIVERNGIEKILKKMISQLNRLIFRRSPLVRTVMKRKILRFQLIMAKDKK